MAYEKCPGYMKNGRCKGNNQLCRVAKEDLKSGLMKHLNQLT